ncbi:MAG: glutamate-5-semialdehyde dehydrogenase [Lachnospiraceae bacterium]|nr:glutamate-5-semialdehyde dehydrogenase [Lachnospiraceae bacterium]
MNLQIIGKEARLASETLGKLTAEEKNRALATCAAALCERTEELLAANAEDVAAAGEKGMSEALIDRLRLTEGRIRSMAEGISQVCGLADPIGEVMSESVRPNGLKITQVRVPIGVIGIIYESRPNVTADAFALCLKTGNAVILRGGSDALRSNLAIARVLRQALSEAGLPENSVQVLTDTSRETAREFMRLREYVDLLIPRGGAGLIRTVVENSTIPVIETGTGNCHVYVDEFADEEKALAIVENAKTQRLGVCNACESLVVHRAVADSFLPKLAARLAQKEVELRGDEESRRTVPTMTPATEEDFAAEYLDRILSVKVADSLSEAIAHINRYHTKHSDCIVTENAENAKRFLREIDSAAVYVNASTRFTDGFEFGFGAEIGISTQKLHARGPMGLIALTSYKYLIEGNGQIRN